MEINSLNSVQNFSVKYPQKDNEIKKNNSINYEQYNLKGLEGISNYNKIAFKGCSHNYIDNIIDNIQHNNTKIDIIKDIENLSVRGKQEFIDKFCEVTGFPDIEEFNNRMIKNSKDVIIKSAENSGANVLWSGFHKNCSAAKGLALPGSDLDGWSVIIDGSQDDKNRFCGEIWENTNPAFASIRHEFPYIFTVDELSEWTNFTDDLVIKNNLYLKQNKYEKNLYELEDFEKAIEFNIDIRNAIKNSNIDINDLMLKCPSLRGMINDKINHCRNNNLPEETAIIWITSDISTCLEQLRSGKTLTSHNENLSAKNIQKLSEIKNSYLCRYGNLSMQELKPGLKPKLKERQEKFSNKNWFNNLSLDEKINMILKMIYESYADWSKNSTYETYSQRDKRLSTKTQNYYNMFDNGININKRRSDAIAKACS